MGLAFSSPTLEHLKIEYAFRLGFKAFNNEAEYNAILASLRLALDVGARQLDVFSDSQFVIRQVS